MGTLLSSTIDGLEDGHRRYAPSRPACSHNTWVRAGDEPAKPRADLTAIRHAIGNGIDSRRTGRNGS